MWANGRSFVARPSLSIEERKRRVREVNRVLTHLSSDKDFQEDLSMPLVRQAVNHWTGASRLPSDVASKLFESDNSLLMGVLAKLRQLQQVCQVNEIPLPLAELLSGSSTISKNWIDCYVGETTVSAPVDSSVMSADTFLPVDDGSCKEEKMDVINKGSFNNSNSTNCDAKISGNSFISGDKKSASVIKPGALLQSVSVLVLLLSIIIFLRSNSWNYLFS